MTINAIKGSNWGKCPFCEHEIKVEPKWREM